MKKKTEITEIAEIKKEDQPEEEFNWQKKLAAALFLLSLFFLGAAVFTDRPLVFSGPFIALSLVCLLLAWYFKKRSRSADLETDLTDLADARNLQEAIILAFTCLPLYESYTSPSGKLRIEIDACAHVGTGASHMEEVRVIRHPQYGGGHIAVHKEGDGISFARPEHHKTLKQWSKLFN